VLITDSDELRVAEGPELTLAGLRFVPYPATPPPCPRPEAGRAGPG
jgi:hypothetical protein